MYGNPELTKMIEVPDNVTASNILETAYRAEQDGSIASFASRPITNGLAILLPTEMYQKTIIKRNIFGDSRAIEALPNILTVSIGIETLEEVHTWAVPLNPNQSALFENSQIADDGLRTMLVVGIMKGQETEWEVELKDLYEKLVAAGADCGPEELFIREFDSGETPAKLYRIPMPIKALEKKPSGQDTPAEYIVQPQETTNTITEKINRTIDLMREFSATHNEVINHETYTKYFQIRNLLHKLYKSESSDKERREFLSEQATKLFNILEKGASDDTPILLNDHYLAIENIITQIVNSREEGQNYSSYQIQDIAQELLSKLYDDSSQRNYENQQLPMIHFQSVLENYLRNNYYRANIIRSAIGTSGPEYSEDSVSKFRVYSQWQEYMKHKQIEDFFLTLLNADYRERITILRSFGYSRPDLNKDEFQRISGLSHHQVLITAQKATEKILSRKPSELPNQPDLANFIEFNPKVKPSLRALGMALRGNTIVALEAGSAVYQIAQMINESEIDPALLTEHQRTVLIMFINDQEQTYLHPADIEGRRGTIIGSTSDTFNDILTRHRNRRSILLFRDSKQEVLETSSIQDIYWGLKQFPAYIYAFAGSKEMVKALSFYEGITQTDLPTVNQIATSLNINSRRIEKLFGIIKQRMKELRKLEIFVEPNSNGLRIVDDDHNKVKLLNFQPNSIEPHLNERQREIYALATKRLGGIFKYNITDISERLGISTRQVSGVLAQVYKIAEERGKQVIGKYELPISRIQRYLIDLAERDTDEFQSFLEQYYSDTSRDMISAYTQPIPIGKEKGRYNVPEDKDQIKMLTELFNLIFESRINDYLSPSEP